MKKIISTGIFALAGIVTLVSCGSKSSAPVTSDTTLDTDIKTNYLSSVAFNDDAMNDVTELKEKGKSYYEVKLPTNIEASKYVNVMDASAFDSKHDHIFAKYASTNNWSVDSYEDIIEILKADDTLGVFTDYATEVEAADDYLDNTEASTRRLAVVYLPVYVVYAKYSSKKLSKTTISYVLVPVYAAITVDNGSGIQDTTASAYSEITFSVKSGKIQ